MSNEDDKASPSIGAPEQRRWLIGIGISLLFGIFGAVMALLNYSDRTKASAPPVRTATVAPKTKATTPATRDRGRRHDRR
jgi:hypothetical protein